MSTPTLINLPPPPSDPVTPSDMGPSTPNSGTTSLSALSTTAIKDGHQGARRNHSSRAHRSSSASDTSTTTLDAERADRISRLAGLERVSAASGAAGGVSFNAPAPGPGGIHPSQGYFDSTQMQMLKERSTVGSASATGSVGGRTTWASGSDSIDQDRMGDDVDDGISSVGGLSDEGNASLVGFGEGANSTVSGPISTGAASRMSGVSRQSSSMAGASASSPSTNRASLNTVPLYSQQQRHPSITSVPPAASSPSPAGSATPEPHQIGAMASEDTRMVDGMTYDTNVVDTTARSPLPVNNDNGSYD